MNRLVIFDGNAIIHRAYHALPPMTTKDGVVVQAVYGFASMLLKAMKDLSPTHIAVTFDMAGKTFRHEKFTEYKATRVKADQALYDQIPLVHDLVRAFGMSIYEKSGYEADDVIGTIAAKATAKEGTEVFVVTGDMDTLQLVRPNVKVYTLRKGMADIVIYDEKEVKSRWGFKPNQMVDYKAIRGDTSDNIPGVPGIGEKGAVDLIEKFGSLENLYAEIDKNPDKTQKKIKPGVYKKLLEGKESAFMSKDLATIDCNVPELDFRLVDTAVKPFDANLVVPFLQKFEFVSLLKRIPGLADAKAEPAPKRGAKKKPDLVFAEVASASDAAKLVKEIIANGSFAARSLPVSKDPFAQKPQALVVVVTHNGYVVTGDALETVLAVLENEKVTLVGHDLKMLIKPVQEQFNIDVKNKLFDVMMASYLLNPGSRSSDVASILLKELGKTIPSAAGQESLFGVDYRSVAEELYLLVQAGEKLREALVGASNLGLFETLEMPLERVLATVELNGIGVDTKKLQELSDHVKNELKTVTKKIYALAGEEFNIASPIQLRDILFEKLQIPVHGIKKGKTGLSTSAEELQKMKGLHPIISEIEIFRELAKLENTYIDVLPTLINPITKRIHTTFNQHIAATGRLSSVDPNLQNIPVRTKLGREIREAFVAAPGLVLVSADYSQIELRIAASLAEDKRMMEIFDKGEDIHTATAAAIHGIPLEKVTKEIRRTAKEINFGILYGMGTYGLSWRAEIPAAEAKAFIEKYFREFSGIKKYIDSTLAFAKKEGYCETLFGRRRYIPELNAGNFQVRQSGERMAINHPIQGTAADLIKLAMVKVQGEIEKLGHQETKMLLQVHDELVLETKPENVEAVKKMLKETMENVVQLRVPVEVHVASGKNWGEME